MRALFVAVISILVSAGPAGAFVTAPGDAVADGLQTEAAEAVRFARSLAATGADPSATLEAIRGAPLAPTIDVALAGTADIVRAAASPDATALSVARAAVSAGGVSLAAVPRSPDVVSAVLALAAVAEAPLTPEDVPAVAALALMAPQTRDAVHVLVDVAAFQARESRAAAATPFVDVPRIAATRLAVVAAVAEALPALQKGGGAVDVCDVIGIDFAGVDNTYTCDYRLQIDVGGDDTYLNNAGAANGAYYLLPFPPRYTVEPASGLLIDVAGADTYGPSPDRNAVAGAAVLGAGALFDFAGDDTYYGTDRHQGDGAARTLFTAANGGAALGAGLLVDAAGDDVYTKCPGVCLRVEAANGAGYQGRGLLVDASGDDQYVNRAEATSGGTRDGSGVLVDLAGDDYYGPGVHVAHGAATGGVGYAALLGRGDGVAVGLLFDRAGDDAYLADVNRGLGAARGHAVGVLADGGGSNVFDGGGARHTTGSAAGLRLESQTGDGNVRAAFSTLSVFLGGAGDDRHTVGDGPFAYALTQGVGESGGLGVVFDAGGVNDYNTTAPGFAQGYGLWGGRGVVVDLGTAPSFSIADNVTGQGGGVNGLGLVFVPDPSATTRYDAAPLADPSRTVGAGIGLRVHNGAADLFGKLPDLSCGAGVTITELHENLAGRDTHVRACGPHDDSRKPIQDPLTGEDLAPTPKPAVPCTSLGVGALQCADVLGVLGPDAVTWMQSDEMSATAGGGLLTLTDVDSLLSTFTFASYDDACDLACDFAFGGFA